MRLEGKVSIVTGAASGIGRWIARVFADEGATLVLVDLNADGLAETQGMLTNAGDRVVTVTADVSKSEDVQRVVQTAADRFGKIDVLVNAHGISPKEDVGDASDVPEEI